MASELNVDDRYLAELENLIDSREGKKAYIDLLFAYTKILDALQDEEVTSNAA